MPPRLDRVLDDLDKVKDEDVGVNSGMKEDWNRLPLKYVLVECFDDFCSLMCKC